MSLMNMEIIMNRCLISPIRISKILSFQVNVLYLGVLLGGIAYVIVVTYYYGLYSYWIK